MLKKIHDKLKGKIELPNGEKISVEEYMKQEIRKIVKELEEHKVQVEDKSSLKDMIKKIWE